MPFSLFLLITTKLPRSLSDFSYSPPFSKGEECSKFDFVLKSDRLLEIEKQTLHNMVFSP